MKNNVKVNTKYKRRNLKVRQGSKQLDKKFSYNSSFGTIDNPCSRCIKTLKDNLRENIKLLEYEIKMTFPKNIIFFQLVFCFELYLKYSLACYKKM